MKNSAKQSVQPDKNIWKSILLSGIVGIGISLILILIFSFVLSNNNLPESTPNILSSIALGVGGFISGIWIAKKHKKRGALLGLLVGVFIFLFILIGNLILFGFNFSNSIIIKLPIAILSSMIGGIIGVNSKKKLKV